MRKIILTALILCSGLGNLVAQDGVKGRPADQGTASYYHNKFEGRKTATGEVFTNGSYTAASNRQKLGTYLKVTNTLNGKVVYVKVNDRMAPSNKRVLDVAEVVAQELGFKNAGTAKVTVEVVTEDEGRSRIIAQREEATGRKGGML